jgi:transposase-like protein
MATPLTDREWNLLETQGFIDEIKEHRRTHGQAATIVEQWRDAVGRDQGRRIRGASEASSQRWETVSQLVAVEARQTQIVVDFRWRILHGRVLRPDEVERFLGALARRQEVKPWVKVYASPEEIDAGIVPLSKATQATYGYDTLEYTVPGTNQIGRVLVSSKGILGWLYWLSDQLSQRYLWRRSDATAFVLTDVAPPIGESDYDVDSSRAVPALTRVIMRLDPAMSPREVAGMYRQIRLSYFGSRHRSMSQKHIELAKFWSSVQDDTPWREVMQQWNKLHPRWAYKREQNFERDCVQARKRLLGQNPVLSAARSNAHQFTAEGTK